MFILTISNNKGGVAKTTSVVNIASYLSKKKRKVLIVDLDPQGNTSSTFIKNSYQAGTAYDAIKDNDIRKYIVNVNKNLDILPANLTLDKANMEFIGIFSRETLLKRLLKTIENEYDIAVLDTSPSMSIMTTNALVASNSIYIPVTAGSYEMDGIDVLLGVIGSIKENLNPDIKVGGIFFTKYDARQTMSTVIREQMQNAFGNVLDSCIRINVALSEASLNKLSIFDFQKNSNGAKDYKALVEEIIKLENI